MNKTLTKISSILASEIECSIFEEHVVPALEVARKVLATQQPEPRDAIARSKRILDLVDSYHENPTQHTRTALRAALMDEFQPEPRAEVKPRKVERHSDMSVLVVFCSTREASVFEKEIRARAGEGQ